MDRQKDSQSATTRWGTGQVQGSMLFCVIIKSLVATVVLSPEESAEQFDGLIHRGQTEAQGPHVARTI